MTSTLSLAKDTTPQFWTNFYLQKIKFQSLHETYYISLKNNKTSKLALANNLQIGIILIVLALVKEGFQ